MINIGFIDYFLDEWHANNYPNWISAASNGTQIVKYAYGDITAPSGMTSEQWCEKNGVTLISSIEELVEKSDCIIVLSPDNAEQHERLSKLPLMSGKRVYIDKPFANYKDEAVRMFDLADKYNTPMFSSSALRFSKELENVDKENVEYIQSRGYGGFEIYGIHQIEPIVSIFGPDAKRIMSVGTANTPSFVIEFSDGRKAVMANLGWDCPFGMAINYKSGKAEVINEFTDFFPRFINNLVNYFETGDVKVPKEETIAVTNIRECGKEALKKPGEWVEISR